MGVAVSARPAIAGIQHPEQNHGPDRAMMARSLVYLFAAGATITVVALLVPHDHPIDAQRMLVTTLCGYAAAAALMVGGGKLPVWSYPLFLGLATLLVEW